MQVHIYLVFYFIFSHCTHSKRGQSHHIAHQPIKVDRPPGHAPDRHASLRPAFSVTDHAVRCDHSNARGGARTQPGAHAAVFGGGAIVVVVDDQRL